MKISEKELLLTLFLEQNEEGFDLVNFAMEGFGIVVHMIESNATSFKSIFEFKSRKIFINRLTTTSDEARFLVGYHIAEYVLKEDKNISMVRLDNMDIDVYALAQKIYHKGENIKNKQKKKGRKNEII